MINYADLAYPIEGYQAFLYDYDDAGWYNQFVLSHVASHNALYFLPSSFV